MPQNLAMTPTCAAVVAHYAGNPTPAATMRLDVFQKAVTRCTQAGWLTGTDVWPYTAPTPAGLAAAGLDTPAPAAPADDDECPFTGPAAQAAADAYTATRTPPAEVPAPTAARPAPTGPTAGTRHAADGHTGVIRHGRTVILDCGHTHTNRDASYPGRLSARDCAERIIRGAARQKTAEHYADKYRLAWTHLPPTVFTRSTIERAQAESDGDARRYLAAVAAVAALNV